MSTIAWWVTYCIAVSASLALGAVAFEAAARATGRAGRWPWLVAMAGSVLVPVISYFRPVHLPATSAGEVGVVIGGMSMVGPDAAASPGVLHPGIVVWTTATLLVIGFVVLSSARLIRARRTWTRAAVDGVPVWLSDDVGPAALGVLRTGIVLPRWVLALGMRARSLMLLHEREHLRAWDPRVTMSAMLLAAAMPWNPVMWVMLRRLRLAIELDCDARVLMRDPDPATYGALLLEVGRRRSGGGFALSTFAEPRSQLEQRIRIMTEWPGTRKSVRAAGLVVCALLLTGGAWVARSPLHSPNAVIIDDGTADSQKMSTELGMAVDTTMPRLLNADEVVRTITAGYPPLLRDAGIGGTPMVAVFVDTAGRVAQSRLAKTSGYDALDAAALKVAPSMRFSPASKDGRRINVWVTLPITYMPARGAVSGSATEVDTVIRIDRAGNVVDTTYYMPPPSPPAPPPAVSAPAPRTPGTPPLRPDVPAPVPPSPDMVPPAVTPPPAPPEPRGDVPAIRAPVSVSVTESLIKAPVMVPMTVTPKLLNPDEVQAAIKRNYPPLLKDAGIGGATKVWFFINEDGRSIKQQIKEPSSYPALDAAALKVAPVLRFSPAENSGKKVAVWVAIDVVFKADK